MENKNPKSKPPGIAVNIRGRSKNDIEELSKKFNELLGKLTTEEIIAWCKENDVQYLPGVK